MTMPIQNHLYWLQQLRGKWHHNSDYWHFKYQITKDHSKINQINSQLKLGTYTFNPAKCIPKLNDEPTILWDARDALLLKTIASGLMKRFQSYFSDKQPNCLPSA